MVVRWWQVVFPEVEPTGFVNKLDVNCENNREPMTAPRFFSTEQLVNVGTI